jgi:hypothetical protein
LEDKDAIFFDEIFEHVFTLDTRRTKRAKGIITKFQKII